MKFNWQRIATMVGFFTAILILGCGGNEASEEAQSTELSGQNIFRQYCVNCHGAKGNLGLNGAGDLTQSTLELQDRVEIVTHGKNTMTAFSTVLSKEEIEKVAAYTMELNENL